MIKIKRTRKGDVRTKVKGKGFDVVEELFNGVICTIEILVKNNCLDPDKVDKCIDDFAQQVKDKIEITTK